jgi:aspartyl-tRNA(Asn)/glutamyl-tRNA(Gln) amidotransferase subunit C
MSEQITPEIFAHMVELAALELNPTEAEYLRKELNNQLKAIHELELIPVEAKTPRTSHGVPYTDQISQPLRQDEWIPDPAASEILEQAPEVEEGYVLVPDIPHIELS